jgi:hypothetical protein
MITPLTTGDWRLRLTVVTTVVLTAAALRATLAVLPVRLPVVGGVVPRLL